MKKIALLLFCGFLTSCGGSEDNASSSEFCSAGSTTGSLSGLSYEIDEIEYGSEKEFSQNLSIENGDLNYSLVASCSEGVLSFSENITGGVCDSGFGYNFVELLCESKIFYSYLDLNAESNIKIFNFENTVVVSPLTTFTTKINDVETYASNVQFEIDENRLKINNFLEGELEVLSREYEASLVDGDEICFEFSSENLPHCYFYQQPERLVKEVSPIVSPLIEDQIVDLSFLQDLEVFEGTGVVSEIQQNSIDVRGDSSVKDYAEINHRVVSFDAPFSIVAGELYNIEIEVNSVAEGAEAVVFIHDKDSFDENHYQTNYIERIRLVVTDDSLREKKISYDFIGHSQRQTEEVKIVVYGENKILIKNIKISKVDTDSDVLGHSLFLSSTPSRNFFETHGVPDRLAPHGMTGGYGYGVFEIDSILESYNIYVNYEDRFETTQAHIYEKSNSAGDSLMGWNINGVDDSAAGGNSQDYLHGTRFQGLGWTQVKDSPFDYAVMLHTQGGHFALSNANFLINFNQFIDETSVGGVTESGTRFNNRVPRKLTNQLLQEQNTNDPLAPIITPAFYTDYFSDQFNTPYLQDDGLGGVELTPLADTFGYSLSDDYLFYLYDDQGVTAGSGGPEGAIVGVLHPQMTYDAFLDENFIDEDGDFDGDGVSDRIEYISFTDPADEFSYPFTDSFDLFPDDGDAFKAVGISISKAARNFNIIVYEVFSNGTEKALWSFDGGRGIESKNIFQIFEDEEFFEIEIISNEISGVVTDLRVEFY